MLSEERLRRYAVRASTHLVRRILAEHAHPFRKWVAVERDDAMRGQKRPRGLCSFNASSLYIESAKGLHLDDEVETMFKMPVTTR
jgi:hypothetical protein